MAAEVKKEIRLEIAHVLFLDVVGYSKLLVDEQRTVIDELNGVVRQTDEYQQAESAGRLIKIPTGDGMALVFYSSPEDPVECALEISRALKEHPNLRVRMGVHSGPVSGVVDLNARANVAGAGINMAQRVMDCGDGGHVLLSKQVSEVLEQYGHWRPHLHDLGECEVKHGVRLSIVNLYTEDLGNPAIPEKVKLARAMAAKERRRALKRWSFVGLLILVAAAAAIGFIVVRNQPQRLITGAAIAAKSIAVLPFENLSLDPDNAFFADGVQDEILTDLARIADLKVISRTSVMQYKSGVARNLREIAQQLGVAHILEGSVQRAGNRVRINAQLIDARTDAHLWAQIYDRDLTDVFAIQSEIARIIADQLQAKITSGEKKAIDQPPTRDVTAFDLYTQGKTIMLSSFGNVLGRTEKAIDLLNQAVAKDPSFFAAYCQLVYAHNQLYFFGYDHTPARLSLAERAMQSALQLRPDAPEVHIARADYLYRGYLDYPGALNELAIARRSLPNDSGIFELTGYILRRQGKMEEGLRNLERALELDPRNVSLLQQISGSYMYMKRYPDQAAALDRALAVEPDDTETRVSRAFVDLSWKADTRLLHRTIETTPDVNPANPLVCALADHDVATASQALQTLTNKMGPNGNAFGSPAAQFSCKFVEGLIARMAKDETKADSAFFEARVEQEKVVQAQPDYGPALCVLALIDAGLGRKEEALREGRRAVELTPLSKDPLIGALMIDHFAIVAAWVGEKNLACEQLIIGAKLPGSLGYGDLKLMPWFDLLRGEPCFEKIVASLAPKKP
jgi:TolB-like protein/class 3 adenylate cyclase/Tfp pilus assembly protein PilF